MINHHYVQIEGNINPHYVQSVKTDTTQCIKCGRDIYWEYLFYPTIYFIIDRSSSWDKYRSAVSGYTTR